MQVRRMNPERKHVILYVHGMGGGGDSRIPSILKDILPEGFEVVIRTYDFDPLVARGQIRSWAEESRPDLVIGESMGATHAIALKGYPHILVSPSLNAPRYFKIMAALVRIPCVRSFFNDHYHPREGDRQPLDFERKKLLRWKPVVEEAKDNTPRRGSRDFFHAYFGRRDKFRRSGVVLVRTWRKWFGEETWTVYDGSHFMEEEYIRDLLVPKILEVTGQGRGQ